MKLSITPSDKYKKHEIEIDDFVAAEKGFSHMQKSEISIISETPARVENGKFNPGAYLLKFTKNDIRECWIPKSQCKIIERKEQSLSFWSD